MSVLLLAFHITPARIVALYHNVFGRIAARMPELLFGNGIGPELLAHEVARIVVRVHVVFAVAELLSRTFM